MNDYWIIHAVDSIKNADSLSNVHHCVLHGDHSNRLHHTVNAWTLKVQFCKVSNNVCLHIVKTITKLPWTIHIAHLLSQHHSVIFSFISSFSPRFPCCSGHRLSLLSLSICLPAPGAPPPGWRPMTNWLGRAHSKASQEAKSIRPGLSTTLGAWRNLILHLNTNI